MTDPIRRKIIIHCNVLGFSINCIPIATVKYRFQAVTITVRREIVPVSHGRFFRIPNESKKASAILIESAIKVSIASARNSITPYTDSCRIIYAPDSSETPFISNPVMIAETKKIALRTAVLM